MENEFCKLRRRNLTRREREYRRYARRWMLAMCVVGFLMVAVPVAFFQVIVACAW